MPVPGVVAGLRGVGLEATVDPLVRVETCAVLSTGRAEEVLGAERRHPRCLRR